MLIDKDKVCLILFNLQLDLIPMLQDANQLLQNCCWLVDLASMMEVPVLMLEHKKLGEIAPPLKQVARQAAVLEKTHFSILSHNSIRHFIEQSGRSQFVFSGAESHVCILQSALNFKQAGHDTYVISDAVSARSKKDHDGALLRLNAQKISLITLEMLFFEMIRHSEYPGYLDLSLKFLDGRYNKYLP